MSSDNFHFVEGNYVWMGDASEWQSYAEEAEADARKRYIEERKRRGRPLYEGETQEDAVRWAVDEYSEYGLWWIDGSEDDHD